MITTRLYRGRVIRQRVLSWYVEDQGGIHFDAFGQGRRWSRFNTLREAKEHVRKLNVFMRSHILGGGGF